MYLINQMGLKTIFHKILLQPQTTNKNNALVAADPVRDVKT